LPVGVTPFPCGLSALHQTFARVSALFNLIDFVRYSVQFVARTPDDCGEGNDPNHDRTESREPEQAHLIS
jgi:hypothetical protein